jgi:hypothetical protein
MFAPVRSPDKRDDVRRRIQLDFFFHCLLIVRAYIGANVGYTVLIQVFAKLLSDPPPATKEKNLHHLMFIYIK